MANWRFPAASNSIGLLTRDQWRGEGYWIVRVPFAVTLNDMMHYALFNIYLKLIFLEEDRWLKALAWLW
jgi:hypothetical protein